MDPLTRARRGEEIAEEIRTRQKELGHSGPMPAFMNLITDRIIELEDRVEQLEAAAAPAPQLQITKTEGQHG